jgi:hypothetical protein
VLTCLEVTIARLQFSDTERKIYDSVYVEAKKKFQQLNAKGLVSKNYTHILAMLMRFVGSSSCWALLIWAQFATSGSSS